MCFIKVTTDGAENCQEIFRINITHPDYATLVDPPFAARQRG